MRNKLRQWLLYLLIFSLGLSMGLVGITKKWSWESKTENVIKLDSNKTVVFEEINPPQGYKLPVAYGSLGPDMLKSGVIDLVKFSETYKQAGSPLTVEQLAILQDGSNDTITISPENNYFLLNFFWAVGLANQTKILTEGEMVKYGGLKEAGNFASTGGWTLSKKGAMNYYAKQKLILLTPEQEDLVAKVTAEMYRPCCNNSTAFPDCNHGMALLGIIQLMASAGATEAQMFEAAKYVNAFWFPSNYYDLAIYFKNKEGKSFAQIDAKKIMSKEFSSASGAQKTKRWLIDQGIVDEPPKQGGGCGV